MLATLDARQWRTLIMMVVAGLHVLGFLTLLAVVAPRHHHLAAEGTFTVGIGVTAYTLGLRHAFDADHIAAIDDTPRRLMAEGERPLPVGFWFSLGHSTIVFALSFLIAIGMRDEAYDEEALDAQLHARGSMNRFFGRFRKPRPMTPVGVLFGLEFDTGWLRGRT